RATGLFVQPDRDAAVVGAGAASRFAEAVRAVCASGGGTGRLGGAFVGFADDVARRVFVGSVGAFGLLLSLFAFAAFARFGFVAALGFGSKGTRAGQCFEFRGAVVPDDPYHPLGRRPAIHRRFHRDAVAADVEAQPVAPASRANPDRGAVDRDRRALRGGPRDRRRGRRDRVAALSQAQSDWRRRGYGSGVSGAGGSGRVGCIRTVAPAAGEAQPCCRGDAEPRTASADLPHQALPSPTSSAPRTSSPGTPRSPQSRPRGRTQTA